MERIVAQIIEIVKSKYAKELLVKDDLKKIEKVFKKTSDEFSKGMIYHKLKRLEIDEQYEERSVKKKVKVLYINLDEDHVAVQKNLNKKLQCKIGYVYENVIKVCKNRYKLTNKHTICGTYLKSSGNKAFYEKINDYIECNYDTRYLEKVIIYEDEAKWITSSTEYIPKSEFRLDKFHLMKSILEAARTVSNNRKRLKSNILRCLYENNKEMLIDLIDDAIGKLRGIQANDGEEAFARIAETYYYKRTHYCEDSKVIKYAHRSNEYYDINKSYISRLQTTIPDYYMNKKILENKDIIIKLLRIIRVIPYFLLFSTAKLLTLSLETFSLQNRFKLL